MGQETAIGREPVFYVEMDLDYCSWLYGDVGCGVNVDNQILQSETLNVTPWVTFESTIVVNQGVDSQGATTLDLINDNINSNTHVVYQNISSIVTGLNQIFCIAFEAEANGKNHVVIEITFKDTIQALIVDLTTGAVTLNTLPRSPTVTVQDKGSGLYRVVLENLDSGPSGTFTPFIQLGPSNATSYIYAGSAGNQGVNVGRVQCNLGTIIANYGTTTTTGINPAIPLGEPCYNTYATCQSRAFFGLSTKTVRLSPSMTKPPLGVSTFPCIVGKPNITPARLEIENGIGQRGAVSINVRDFPYNDIGFDKYISRRISAPAGNFFSKLRRRFPFYQNRPFRLVTGYLSGGAIVDTTTRLYLIDSFDGPDRSGNFTIKSKDVLKLADDKEAICPREYDLALNAAITNTATSIALRSGDGAKLPASSGTVRIDDEIIGFSGLTTDTLTGCTRGQWGTTADAHDADKKVDLCKTWSSVNVVNIIEELLTDFAGVDAALIPFDDGAPGDEWDDEKSNWLSSNNLTHVISRPTKVSELLKQLCIQNSLSIWYNEVEQLVKLSATSIALGNQVPTAIDDHANIINDSLKMVEDKDSRLSQIWIFFDPKDSSEAIDEPNNYQDIRVYINDDFENAAAYGEPRVERIYANWLTAANAGIVATMASRLLLKDTTQTFKIDFALDAKDAALWTGKFALLTHPDIQGVDGLPEVQKVQITQVKEVEPGHRYEYQARAKVFNTEQRFFFIASNSLTDYASASDTEKAENGFISDGDAPFSDGGAAYSIT